MFDVLLRLPGAPAARGARSPFYWRLSHCYVFEDTPTVVAVFAPPPVDFGGKPASVFLGWEFEELWLSSRNVSGMAPELAATISPLLGDVAVADKGSLPLCLWLVYPAEGS